MKKAVLTLTLIAMAGPAWAHGHHSYSKHQPDWAVPSQITCDTVRSYVSQVGLAQARAIARANGMTSDQERRARRCLARNT
jgi:hypothetical protein